MNKIDKIIIYSILGLCLILNVVGLVRKESAIGAYIDNGQVTRFTDMNITNDLVVDGQATFTGTSTLGKLAISGTTSLAGPTTISSTTVISAASIVKIDAATSTLQIGSTADGVLPGCLVLGSTTATASPVYITATGATITATTTKPVYCR